MNKHEFNEHGVCINPTIVLNEKHDKMGYLILKVAEKGGKWTYGYSYGNKTGGGGSGCSFYDYCTFDSKEGAIDVCIDRLKRHQGFNEGGDYAWHLRKLNEYKSSMLQLELF